MEQHLELLRRLVSVIYYLNLDEVINCPRPFDRDFISGNPGSRDLNQAKKSYRDLIQAAEALLGSFTAESPGL